MTVKKYGGRPRDARVTDIHFGQTLKALNLEMFAPANVE